MKYLFFSLTLLITLVSTSCFLSCDKHCNKKTNNPAEEETSSTIPTLADAAVIYTVEVDKISCQQCLLKVHDALAPLPHYVAEEADKTTNTIRIGFSKAPTNTTAITTALEQAGFTITKQPKQSS